ncbi:hypothetical protein NF418_06515 [Streptococcus suis]|uniref:hypothetical protein n=1 Tax=Streptococcus suis TaxID=1307 RepID=UPI002118B816|nr:hypothetical protein [Streptococcus suis]
MLTARQIGRIVTLTALCIVLRIVFGPFPNIKPLAAIFLVSISYLGIVEATLLMVLTMISSGILFGFGIHILWQVLSFAVVQIIWKGLLTTGYIDKERTILVQSILAGLLAFMYGLIISIFTAMQFGISLIPFWLNGLFFDMMHGLSTLFFYPIIFQIFRRFDK